MDNYANILATNGDSLSNAFSANACTSTSYSYPQKPVTTTTTETTTSVIKKDITFFESTHGVVISAGSDIHQVATAQGPQFDQPGTPVAANVNQNAINQRFCFKRVGNGNFTIHPHYNSELSLDVRGARATEGAQVWLYKNNSMTWQQWKIKELESGYIQIVSALDDDFVVDFDASGKPFKLAKKNHGISQMAKINAFGSLACREVFEFLAGEPEGS